jgi:hypothetical protein
MIEFYKNVKPFQKQPKLWLDRGIGYWQYLHKRESEECSRGEILRAMDRLNCKLDMEDHKHSDLEEGPDESIERMPRQATRLPKIFITHTWTYIKNM